MNQHSLFSSVPSQAAREKSFIVILLLFIPLIFPLFLFSEALSDSLQGNSQHFTIKQIEPDSEKAVVVITFSEQCEFNKIRNSLKVYPPANLNWYDSALSKDKKLTLQGGFIVGQSYAVFLPKTLNCNGRTYRETFNTFTMPDLNPSIEFAGKGTVIERDSRQMLHVRLTNIDEVLFQGLSIPPLLLPEALEKIKKISSIDVLKGELESKNEILKKLFFNIEGLKSLLGKIREDRELFFPGIEHNKKQLFSADLGFRKKSKKGALQIIQLRSQGLKKTRYMSPDVESPVQLFRITDIALAYKKASHTLLIWTTSLRTGKPLRNVSIAVFSKDSTVSIVGQTDNNGILVLRNGLVVSHISLENGKKEDIPLNLSTITTVLAKKSDDLSFIVLKTQDHIKLDWVKQASPNGKSKSHIKGFLFTERGIYRPGDTVYYKGTVRQYDGKIFPPQGEEVLFEIINPKNEKVYEKKAILSDFGTASGEFKTQSYFPLGTYTITMTFAQGEEDKVSSNFEVQEFRPPRHFVKIHFSKGAKKDERYINVKRDEHFLKCEISGKYYAGGPVKHGKVRWKVLYKGTSYELDHYKGFTFGHIMERGEEFLESGESILNEKGNVTVTIPLSKEILFGTSAIELTATVVDFDGRAATERTVYQQKPDFLVGISSHEELVRAGKPEKLEVIVLNLLGNKVTKGTIAAEVMERNWVYVKKRNDRGDAYWQWQEVWQRHLGTTLSIERGSAFFDFDFLWCGDYFLKFTYTDRKGRTYISSTKYTVEGDFYGHDYENRERNFQKLSLRTDKKIYSPGEKIKLSLNPHQKLSSILMTVERDNIITYRFFKGTEKTIALKAEDNFAPNVYISVLGTVAREDFPVYTGQFDDMAPTFLIGVVNINVKKDVGKLSVDINPAQGSLKAVPGENLTFDLHVFDEKGRGIQSEAAFCIVDESVLALTGYQTPSLETLSTFTLPLSIFTGDSRTELLKQTPFTYISEQVLTGGGGDSGKGKTAATLRKDFRPLAYFNPAVVTDNKGKARVSFKVPDTMTQYRVYAVACDRGSRFGSSQEELTVVKDFYLEPGIPRFFTKGDQFTFSVSAFNKTDDSGIVALSTHDNSLITMSPLHKKFSLKDYDRTLIPIKGEATGSGKAKLFFSGEFEGKKDALELSIPVNTGLLLWNDVVFGTARDNSQITYSFPEAITENGDEPLNPHHVKVLLTVSGSPFIRMSKGFSYLLHYPYGCVEQTSSAIMPLAALRDLIQKGLIPELTIKDTDKFLKKGIERLFTMQTDSGGFGYWPGNVRPHQWGTIYAASALSHVQIAGIKLPEVQMKKAMTYLKEELKAEIKKKASSRDKAFTAYAAYILSLNKMLESVILKKLLKDIDTLDRESALLILLAAQKAGYLSDEELKGRAKFAFTKEKEIISNRFFYAPYRKTAIALLAGASLLPGDPLTDKKAAELLEGVGKNGIWTSTSDTGWALIALGKYFSGASFSDKAATVILKQPGMAEQKISLKTSGFHTFELNAESFITYPSLTLITEGDLMYMLSVSYPRVDFAKNGYSNGFVLHKSVINTDGSSLIKVGDVVKVELTLSIEDNDYRYIAIDDPLPAGLVAINTALKTEEHFGREREQENGSYWNYWDFDGSFYRFVPNYFEMRDDRVFVFRNKAWKGTYRYSYYARAVCEGEFVMPSTKVQLMYDPDIMACTAVDKLVIQAR